jgi:hypothetical protein
MLAFPTLPHQNGGAIMSDNPLEPGPQDYDRINVNVEADIAYWSRELGVTRAQLAAAIEEAGPGVLDVKRNLEGKTARKIPLPGRP